MMNSAKTNEAYAGSPFTSFVGIEGSGSTQQDQKYNLWDWDSPNLYTSHNTSILDCPPPLLSATAVPFYFPPQPPLQPAMAGIPDHFFKLEDRFSGGFGGTGSSRLGLNLGQMMYFPSGNHQLLLFQRSAHHQPPRCQAEGCRADLSGAKHYHRRHKVCEFHSKAAIVFFPGGVQQRFCQQCSRFHGLGEFDDAKRSCRRRLAEHNRRRRKPQNQHSTKASCSSSSSAPETKPNQESKQSAAKAGKQLTCMKKSSYNIAPVLSYENTNLEWQQKSAMAQLTTGSALSLGGVGHGGEIQEQRVSTLSNFDNYFHHHSLSNEDSHSIRGGSEMNHQNQSSILQLGQAMFEWDFI